ncbi:MAG: aromatic amino acid aminotransferase [Candidatus Cloacimonadota bacterium]|nr:MAG: aromatic amino acid aminotransferase [Candidatus Cloacimonadota bacterium]
MNRFRKNLDDFALPQINVPRRKLMMCLNESNLDPFETLKSEFLEKMKNVRINRYFSHVTDDILQKLSSYVGYGINEKQIVFGNGADDMLYFLFTAARENNDSFLVSFGPSYFDYKTYARAVGLKSDFVSLNDDFSFDEDKFIAKLKNPDCVLGILCNPNNPTGNLLPEDKMIKIITATDKPVLIDETYFEYSKKTFADRLNKYPNIIILRSFSKAYSSAGLRFGYLIGSEENIINIKKVIPHFNSSILIQAFVSVLLENKEIILSHTEKIISERERVLKSLKEMPNMTVHPSQTNFLIFSIGERSQELFAYLEENEIAVRNVGNHPVLKNHLRVTVSTADENNIFLGKVRQFLEK